MKLQRIRKRIFEILQIGRKGDTPSIVFDAFITVVIIINLAAVIFSTYDSSAPFKKIIDIIELVTVIIFTVEYILRLWTAVYLYPSKKSFVAALFFVFSLSGIVDLLTFFPYYLPVVFPSGVVAFRIFRVIRIFRLFRINQKYDAFNVIIDVLKDKKKQIISSISLVLILMVAASLCMYSLEHDAQPELFKNAFSGIWWATSTLLTIGYGDIYPVTTAGKILAIIISFLGVGMVAIPTGIISAGFVEQYTKINKLVLKEEEKPLKFVTALMCENHPWCNKMVREVVFPPEIVLVVLIRDEEEIVPRGDLVMKSGDVLVLGAKHFTDKNDISLNEIIIKEEHEWVGAPIKLLDISRQELIVMIQRKNKVIIPTGDTKILAGDHVIMYQKKFESRNN